MLIAQITDTHIVEKGRKTLGVAPMAQNLAKVVNHINHLQPMPDVVLLTGDVIDNGKAAELRNAATILSKFEIPFFVIPGNHDNRTNLWDEFADGACPSRSGEFINYVIEDFDVRLIGLDSTIPDAAGGELCQSRLAWLEECLAKKPNRPTMIFMHHPPIKCGVLETDMDGFIGSQQLAAIVGKFPCIERIICGHIHLPTHASWNGTVISTAPSIGMRLGLDLTMTRESEFFLDAPGYQLHHWIGPNMMISHTQYVDDARGPFLFEEQ